VQNKDNWSIKVFHIIAVKQRTRGADKSEGERMELSQLHKTYFRCTLLEKGCTLQTL